jgi:hypothetical protein
MDPTVYGVSIVFISILGIISYSLTIAKKPVSNALYGASSSLLLTYSIGFSLLLYGMMIYLYSAFPSISPRIILLLDIILLLVSLWTMFLNPWQVQNRRNGRSGQPSQDPAFLSVTLASVFILIPILFLLYQYRAFEQQLDMLLLINILVVPFFFFTSSSINSYALNNFTYNF